jgi:uncharacterized membrane protein YebE (DUF533 family)
MTAPDFNSVSVRADTITGKTYTETEVQAFIAAAVLDGQLRAFERGRLDTPDELRGLDAKAALERMLQEAYERGKNEKA